MKYTSTMRSINELRTYQGKAIEFLLSHPQAGLFLDMGLGKTASALTAVKEFIRFGVGATLVVGPIRVIETVWRQEMAKWEHLQGLTFSLVRGNETERRAALAVKADIYLINPEHLTWLLDTLGDAPYPFETLFVDESSMFKNVGTKRFRTLRYKVKNFARRYLLTGTPTPNKLLELWPQIFLLDLGKRLGTSYGRYKERFFDQDYTGYKWTPKPGAEEKIYALIADLVLRMDAADYLVLPKVTYNTVAITLPAAIRKIYTGIEKDAFFELSKASFINAVNAPAALTKCRQIANGIVYTNDGSETEFLHNEKLKVTKSIVEESGSPVIVVYNFKHELELLKETLKEFEPVVLKDSKDTEATIADWNAGKIQVLLLHPVTGGHGLNLQDGGHTMVWFGLTFSYEQYVQTIARINRQGQKYPVMIHILTATNTVDELIADTLAAKAQGQDRLFDYLKAYAAKHH